MDMKIAALMLGVVLLVSLAFGATADPAQVDYESMTLEEVQTLAQEANDYYKEMTTVPSAKGKEARSLLTYTLESTFSGQEVIGPLFGFDVKRERDVYTIDGDFTTKIEKQKTKHTVHVVMVDTGKLEITELVIDGADEDAREPAATPELTATPEPTTALESAQDEGEETQQARFNEYGEQVSMIENDGVCVLKYKIKPSFSNKMTIQQNYHTVENFIRDGGGDQYDEIQYWAVATMTDGSEGKVISFTVSKELIAQIKEKQVVALQMGDYVEDLWILPSLIE